jgi:hypothetical protein
MGDYRKKLRAYLDQNPMQYTEGDTLLEQLYWCYTNANTMDSPALRAAFRELYTSMPELSEDRFDRVFSVVCSLSALQEELAFKAGAKVGFRLAAELLES